MLIERRSPFTGKVHQREIDVTPQQLALWIEGYPIQRAMPHLSADDREFIKTGITPEEWAETFGTEAAE